MLTHAQIVLCVIFCQQLLFWLKQKKILICEVLLILLNVPRQRRLPVLLGSFSKCDIWFFLFWGHPWIYVYSAEAWASVWPSPAIRVTLSRGAAPPLGIANPTDLSHEHQTQPFTRTIMSVTIEGKYSTYCYKCFTAQICSWVCRSYFSVTFMSNDSGR